MRALLANGWPLLALSLVPQVQGCDALAGRAGENIVNPVMTREYSAEAIGGRVVDAETGRPLENVVVVAVWELIGGLEGGSVLGAAQVLETVTDVNGRYQLPAWGPIQHAGRGSLDVEAPKLLFIKQGYRFSALKNFDATRSGSDPIRGRRSIWNGQTVTLSDLQADPKALGQSFSALQSALYFAEQEQAGCYWKKIPLAIRESMQQARALSARGITYLSEIGAYLLANAAAIEKRSNPGCGSPRRFVEDLQR